MANPVSLQVGDNLDAIWKPYLVTAVGDWDMSSVLSTTTAGAATQPKGTPPAVGQIAFDTPAQWGRRV